jgi:hypothetical protein
MSTTIRSLLLRSSPSAIARLVVAVVVYAIDAEALRPLAHVSKKREEVVLPAITNPYAAAAVPGVPHIGASSQHSAPNLVLCRVGAMPISSSPVRSRGLGYAFSAIAATTRRLPSTKRACHDDLLTAASTHAPPRRSGATSCWRDGAEATKGASGEIGIQFSEGKPASERGTDRRLMDAERIGDHLLRLPACVQPAHVRNMAWRQSRGWHDGILPHLHTFIAGVP